MTENILIKYPQKVIAKHFGFTKNITVTNRIKVLTNNSIHQCKCCGNIQDQGYIDPKNTLITRTNNYMYSYNQLSSPFLCSYCHFISYNFLKQYQKNKIGDIGNILVFEKKFYFKNFNSSSYENDLFKLFKTPPKPPFIIMIKEQINASTITNMSHNIKVTIDTEVFNINYGLNTFIVFRLNVLKCLDSYYEIRQGQNSEIYNKLDVLFFNKSNTDKFHFILASVSKNKELLNTFVSFINEYNEETRFVAKILFKTYFIKVKGIKINGSF